jgi:lipopolysaccharide transport system ATP-binding protein
LEKNIYAISFFKSDAESFGDGGATIVDAGFFDDKGERLATVTGGQSVQFVVRLLPHQRIRYPAIGLMLKDRLGQYLYTEGTDLPFRHHHLMLEPNEVVETVFQFKMPILIRGKYTMNVAVAEGLGDNHIQHHWIHDAITIESISGPVVHGIGGLLDMEITIRFPQTSQKVVA